ETVVRVEGRVAVLPGGLQSSKRPPETLFGEISGVLRRFGVRSRLFFIADIESKTADRQRQIRVLGECIIAEPARGQDQIFPPCTDGARHHCDRVQQVQRPTVQVEAAYIL